MEEDEKKGIRQRSIAIIFVNKMKTGEFLINFIREVGLCGDNDT